jgi:hypothetical protein
VLQLIAAYRFQGVRTPTRSAGAGKAHIPELDPAFYGLTEPTWTRCSTPAPWCGSARRALRDILSALRDTYCGTIGASTCTSATAQKRWIQERLERSARPQLRRRAEARILERLTAAETLERYLHTRYVGQKRFSLEGGETLIPQLDELLQRAGAGRAGARDRHGAPRAAQRAGQHAGQDAEGPVRRVRGQARRRAARGRREVPPGLLVDIIDAGRPDAPDARVQSVAPRDRQSGGRGLGARAPAPPRRPRRATRCCRC